MEDDTWIYNLADKIEHGNKVSVQRMGSCWTTTMTATKRKRLSDLLRTALQASEAGGSITSTIRYGEGMNDEPEAKASLGMVEKVARALAYHDYDTEDVWESHVSSARAAIEAMREPTEAMLRAASELREYGDDCVFPGPVAETWPAMIDVALQATEGGGST